METTRRKSLTHAALPAIMAMLLIGKVVDRPSMATARTIDIFFLVGAGFMLGVVFATTLDALRNRQSNA